VNDTNPQDTDIARAARSEPARRTARIQEATASLEAIAPLNDCRSGAGMRQVMAKAIDAACRRALYLWLGLRIPADRIQHEDICALRKRAKERVFLALGEAEYWLQEVKRLDEARDRASRRLRQTSKLREHLRNPNPTQSTDSV